MLLPLLVSIFGAPAAPVSDGIGIGAIDAYVRARPRLDADVAVYAQLDQFQVSLQPQLSAETVLAPRLTAIVRTYPL